MLNFIQKKGCVAKMSETVKEYVDIPCKRRGRPSNRPDNKTLQTLYFQHSVQEIADMFGVARPTVYGWAMEARKEYREHVKNKE